MLGTTAITSMMLGSLAILGLAGRAEETSNRGARLFHNMKYSPGIAEACLQIFRFLFLP